MKTIAVYQVHPYGEGQIVCEVVAMHSDGDFLYVDPQCGQVLPEQFKGNLPEPLRQITFSNYHIGNYNYLAVRGAVLVESKLHFVSVDFFFCDNDVILQNFLK